MHQQQSLYVQQGNQKQRYRTSNHISQLYDNHHHQLQSGCIPSGKLDTFEDLTSNMAECCNRVVAATQTYANGHHANNKCEHTLTPTVSLGTVTVPSPPVLYTVHRVITTAQIQAAVGSTFTTSSSVASVVNTVRNDPKSADVSELKTDSLNHMVASSNEGRNNSLSIFSDSATCSSKTEQDSSIDMGNSSLNRKLCGTSSKPSFLLQNSKYSGSFERQREYSRTSYGNSALVTTQSSTTFSSGARSPLVPRPLQNVIPTCVYLMSRIAVHMEIDGTAQCPAQVMLAAALGCEELGIANKLLAQSIFGLWMNCNSLEIQLKSHHHPFAVRIAWKSILEKFGQRNSLEHNFDEPILMLKRNVFFSRKDEEKIKDHRILELLYEEAKHNVLARRYIMDHIHALMLGGIQARIELGPFNAHLHTVSFFRENQHRFLPQNVAKSTCFSWLPVSHKNSAEVKLLEQYKRVPQTATTKKLMRKYLEFCWALPFYGAAFFYGQVEQPIRGILSLMKQTDKEVIITVNEWGISVIDPEECTLMVGLSYEDFSWDFAQPRANDDPECLTCIFIQFDTMENGTEITKLMQIFSKQAILIDALISHFTEQTSKRKQNGPISDLYHDDPNPVQNNGNGVLCNKLSRLTLASFDEEGRCLGQMGSLSISY